MKAKARILLVEDESIIADSIEQMLRVSGYEVTSVVDSGEAAVQIAGEDPPDVGLLDVKLAGKIDGIEAAKQIRASRDIPVIYLTAHSDKNLIDRAKITEPFGYLLKPIDERELCATIEMTLYKHRLEMELKGTNRRLKQEIAERERAEEELKQYRDHLEELVEERAAGLIETNKQLQCEITERKRAEETLRESEERFRTLVENQGEGVGIVDPEEQFTFANPAADRIFGVPLGSLVGKNLREFLESEQFARIRQQTEKRKRGEASTYETELVHPDGEKRRLLVTVTPQFDNTHRYIGALGIFRDITERKRVEEALKASYEQLRNLPAYLQAIREEERTTIAREIHDELGQALVALKMDLSWLKRRFTDDQPELLEKAYAMEALIDSIIQVVKKIVTKLRPGLLDDLGLSAAIEWQAEEFQQRTGILCDVLIDPEDIILKDDVSTAVFRIFQETLTNVVRHAHATQVHVLLRETEDNLLLEVRDNGKGITPEQLSDPKSFGLIGIRERAQFLGGQVTFQGIPYKGTTVTVSIPLNNS